MLFQLNTNTTDLLIVDRIYLRDFGWDERKFQNLLFNNFERVVQEDELIVIMQSRYWQEEPDIMAIDKNGTLYIFELKAWESESSNLLQVLRYGQKFGQYNYEQLNDLFKDHSGRSLIETHNKRFPELQLKEEDFNKKQKFIVLTNGIDVRTRQSVIYWKNQGIDINSWIYRIYRDKNMELFLEFDTFKTIDDPFEDIEGGYFILNTNYNNDIADDEDMLRFKKAAAYYDPWKYQINRIQKGAKVFLYRSGFGIVARGISKGVVKKANYHNYVNAKDEEFYVELDKFSIIKIPFTASEIKKISEIDYRFMKTCFSVDKETGDEIWKQLNSRL